jgi:hypothetical protein
VAVLLLVSITLTTLSTIYIANFHGAGQVKGEYIDLYELVECVHVYEEAHSSLPENLKDLETAYDEAWQGKRHYKERFGNKYVRYFPISKDASTSSFILILEGAPFLQNATMVGYQRPSTKNPAKSSLYVYARGIETVRDN